MERAALRARRRSASLRRSSPRRQCERRREALAAAAIALAIPLLFYWSQRAAVLERRAGRGVSVRGQPDRRRRVLERTAHGTSP